jgi:hypothetical protein
VSRFASSSLRPSSAGPASSLRSIRATSVSVATPGSNSATSFTRHTSFGTAPLSPAPVSQEPIGAATRGPAPHGFACSPCGAKAAGLTAMLFILAGKGHNLPAW